MDETGNSNPAPLSSTPSKLAIKPSPPSERAVAGNLQRIALQGAMAARVSLPQHNAGQQEDENSGFVTAPAEWKTYSDIDVEEVRSLDMDLDVPRWRRAMAASLAQRKGGGGGGYLLGPPEEVLVGGELLQEASDSLPKLDVGEGGSHTL